MRFKDWYVENRKGFVRDVGKLGIFWAIQNLNKKYAEDSKAAMVAALERSSSQARPSGGVEKQVGKMALA